MTKRTLVSTQDLEEAFNELQSIEAQMVMETADANQKIASIRDGVVPAVSSLEERAARLRNSITAWAEAHADDEDFFPKGRKTFDLMSGTIQIRKDPPSLVLRDGWKTGDVVAELQEADSAIKKAGLKQPDPTLDKTALKKLYDQGKIDDKALKALGLEIKEGESILISTKTIDKVEV